MVRLVCFPEFMKQKCLSFIPEIKVVTKKEGDNVKIKFYDNGIGISQENLEKVFDIEFTTKPQSEVKGGYGLPYTYKVMKEHKGSVEIRSQEGEWTEIILITPYKKSR